MSRVKFHLLKVFKEYFINVNFENNPIANGTNKRVNPIINEHKLLAWSSLKKWNSLRKLSFERAFRYYA